MTSAAANRSVSPDRPEQTTGSAPGPEVDLDLLEKYDVPAPRYTSYPTVPQFEEMAGEAALEGLEAENSGDRPLSLYFHIPYCRRLCWYCACNRVIAENRERAEPYLDTVFRELDRRRPVLEGRRVEQVHLGGGTPTFLPADQLRRLGRELRSRFEFAGDAEVALEIDPRECSREQVDALREVGFNRASLGVQDHDPEVQEAINRRQPYEMTAEVVEWLREAGFRSINFDLVYGLPRQTEESFRSTLDDLVELGPERLAVYSYAHVPWKHPAQKLLEDEGIPDARTKLELLNIAIDRFTRAGYRYIGLDHFAKPDDALARAFDAGTLRRNFQGYGASSGTDVHAFGVSGISQTETMYIQNEKDLENYREAVDEQPVPAMRGYRLDRDDRIRRAAIERIMCRPRLRYDEMEEQFGVEFGEYFADELEALAPLEEDGLVEVGERKLRVTARGRLLLRNIASRFDAYLDSDRERFSSAV